MALPGIGVFIDKRPRIGLLQLDASVSEQHQDDGELTDNPVERGASMSDHYVDQPRVLTMEGLVSANFRWLDARSPFDLTINRHLKAWQILTDLKRSHVPFAVVTSLQTYQNMMFMTLSATRDRDNSNVLRFTATLREVQFASTSELLEAFESTDEFADLGDVANDAGTQGTTEAAEPIADAALEALG